MPVLVAVAFAALVGSAAAPGVRGAIVDQLRDSEELDPSQREELIGWIESNTGVATAVLAAGSVVTTVATIAFWSLLLHAGATMTFATRPDGFTFTHSLALVAHANLVNLPQLLIQLLLLAEGSNVSFSLAGLAGVGAGSPLGVALAWVAPFNLWWLGLLGLGISVLFDIRLSRAIWLPVAISLGLRALQATMATLPGAPA